jgi:hypothetical protein
VERAGGKSWGAAANGTAGGSSSDEEQLSGDGAFGSGSSSEEDEQQQQGPGQAGSRKKGAAGQSLEMTVTFTPGLEKLGQRLRDKKQQEAAAKGDSVWEAYLRWDAWRWLSLLGVTVCGGVGQRLAVWPRWQCGTSSVAWCTGRWHVWCCCAVGHLLCCSCSNGTYACWG